MEWMDLVDDIHQVIYGLLDPFQQQRLAVTCRAHYQRWYDPAAQTGRWMGKHMPAWERYLDHSLTRTEGILQGLVEGRRFPLLREMVQSDGDSFILSSYCVRFPNGLCARALRANGTQWLPRDTMRTLFLEAADSGYGEEELRELTLLVPGAFFGQAEDADIRDRFFRRGQLQLLLLLFPVVGVNLKPTLLQLFRCAEEPLDWDWILLSYSNTREGLYVAIAEAIDVLHDHSNATGRALGHMLTAVTLLPKGSYETGWCKFIVSKLVDDPRFNVKTITE